MPTYIEQINFKADFSDKFFRENRKVFNKYPFYIKNTLFHNNQVNL